MIPAGRSRQWVISERSLDGLSSRSPRLRTGQRNIDLFVTGRFATRYPNPDPAGLRGERVGPWRRQGVGPAQQGRYRGGSMHVERLTRQMGFQGCRRGRIRERTTIGGFDRNDQPSWSKPHNRCPESTMGRTSDLVQPLPRVAVAFILFRSKHADSTKLGEGRRFIPRP